MLSNTTVLGLQNDTAHTIIMIMKLSKRPKPTLKALRAHTDKTDNPTEACTRDPTQKCETKFLKYCRDHHSLIYKRI